MKGYETTTHVNHLNILGGFMLDVIFLVFQLEQKYKKNLTNLLGLVKTQTEIKFSPIISVFEIKENALSNFLK